MTLLKKINIYSLSIEITRQCNMCCIHCMRGNAENVNLDPNILNSFLKQVKDITTLTITGGEPSLVPEIMIKLLRKFQKYKVTVGNIYIVTNGKKITNKFITACIEWYLYCYDNEISAVCTSKDMFHEPVWQDNIKKLEALSFFNNRDKNTDFTKTHVLNIGRAKTLHLPNVTKNDRPYFEEIECETIDEHTIEVCSGNITVTTNGDILSQCDYAYNETDAIKIGDVNDDMYEIFKQYL